MTWRALAVLAFVAVVAFSLGAQMPRWIAERPATPASPVQEVSTPRPPETPPALRCYQGVTFDGKNQPNLTQRAWTQAEAEARLHAAQMSLRSAESHGVWTDLGRRWAQLAEAQLAEVRLCWPGGGG
jgi:hypothetical protein